MSDLVDQTNFPLVKWANAVSGCVSSSVCVYVCFETKWTTKHELKMSRSKNAGQPEREKKHISFTNKQNLKYNKPVSWPLP